MRITITCLLWNYKIRKIETDLTFTFLNKLTKTVSKFNDSYTFLKSNAIIDKSYNVSKKEVIFNWGYYCSS